MQPVSLPASAPDFSRRKPHGADCSLTGAGVPLRQRGQYVGCHQPGRLRTGNTAGVPAGPEQQVTAVTASGTGLGYGEGDESYGYDSCGYLKAQSAGRHRISVDTDMYQRAVPAETDRKHRLQL